MGVDGLEGKGLAYCPSNGITLRLMETEHVMLRLREESWVAGDPSPDPSAWEGLRVTMGGMALCEHRPRTVRGRLERSSGCDTPVKSSGHDKQRPYVQTP